MDEEIVKTWWEAFVNHDPVRLKQEYPWELAWARYVTSLSCGIHVGRITCVLPLVPIQISKYQNTFSYHFERRRYSSILFFFNMYIGCVVCTITTINTHDLLLVIGVQVQVLGGFHFGVVDVRVQFHQRFFGRRRKRTGLVVPNVGGSIQ